MGTARSGLLGRDGSVGTALSGLLYRYVIGGSGETLQMKLMDLLSEFGVGSVDARA